MYVCVYVVSRSHKSHEWGLHNQSQQQQSCCKRSAYSKYVYYYMVLVQCINISTCRFLSCTPNLYILRQLVQKKCTKGRSDLGLVVISLWNASKQGGQESSYHIVVDIWGWNCGSSGYYLHILEAGGQGEKFHAFQNDSTWFASLKLHTQILYLYYSIDNSL